MYYIYIILYEVIVKKSSAKSTKITNMLLYRRTELHFKIIMESVSVTALKIIQVVCSNGRWTFKCCHIGLRHIHTWVAVALQRAKAPQRISHWGREYHWEWVPHRWSPEARCGRRGGRESGDHPSQLSQPETCGWSSWPAVQYMYNKHCSSWDVASYPSHPY